MTRVRVIAGARINPRSLYRLSASPKDGIESQRLQKVINVQKDLLYLASVSNQWPSDDLCGPIEVNGWVAGILIRMIQLHFGRNMMSFYLP
jgi:hypothetical protein